MRSGGKQLLETIDNLIDLTQIDERRCRRQQIDVARSPATPRPAAPGDGNRSAGHVAVDGLTTATALGDAWATRRILDNLLANAIGLTPPGGSVSLSVDRAADTVTLRSATAAPESRRNVTRHFQDDAPDLYGVALPARGGTGLTLSNRLARTMDGRLTVHETPGSAPPHANASDPHPDPDASRSGITASGATISLSLPAAYGPAEAD